MNFEFEDYCARRKKIWRARFAGTIARPANETPPSEIWLSIGSIDLRAAELIMGQLENDPDAPAIITLNTTGGSVPPALDLYDAIRAHAGHTTAMVPPGGKCYSAGILPLIGCDFRIADASAEFLIHGVGSRNAPENHGRHTAFSLQTAAAEFAEFDEQMGAIIRLRSFFNAYEVQAALQDERWFYAGEALNRGLIHFVS